MANKQISPLVGAIIGVVVLVAVVALGYKFFLAPQPLPSVKDHPPRAGYTQYPGGASYPGSKP